MKQKPCEGCGGQQVCGACSPVLSMCGWAGPEVLLCRQGRGGTKAASSLSLRPRPRPAHQQRCLQQRPSSCPVKSP